MAWCGDRRPSDIQLMHARAWMVVRGWGGGSWGRGREEQGRGAKAKQVGMRQGIRRALSPISISSSIHVIHPRHPFIHAPTHLSCTATGAAQEARRSTGPGPGKGRGGAGPSLAVVAARAGRARIGTSGPNEGTAGAGGGGAGQAAAGGGGVDKAKEDTGRKEGREEGREGGR
jgi:hypothetical protein